MKRYNYQNYGKYLICAISILFLVNCGGGGGSNNGAYIEAFAYTKVGDQLVFTWALMTPGDGILLYRGDEAVAQVAGDATSYTYTISSYEYARYTAALYVGSVRVDQEEIYVNTGNVKWDPPIGWDPPISADTGYFLYLAEAVGNPYQVLPYNDPNAFSFDTGPVEEVSLKSLYNDLVIESGESYYIAVSSYHYDDKELIISPLSYPLTFSYEVNLKKTEY